MERMIKERDETIADQAAVIEKLRDAVFSAQNVFSEYAQIHAAKNPPDERKAEVNQDLADQMGEALAIPTDSKQILAEWLDSQLGEPVAWESHSMGLTYENHYSDNVPLFKKPEVFK